MAKHFLFILALVLVSSGPAEGVVTKGRGILGRRRPTVPITPGSEAPTDSESTSSHGAPRGPHGPAADDPPVEVLTPMADHFQRLAEKIDRFSDEWPQILGCQDLAHDIPYSDESNRNKEKVMGKSVPLALRGMVQVIASSDPSQWESDERALADGGVNAGIGLSEHVSGDAIHAGAEVSEKRSRLGKKLSEDIPVNDLEKDAAMEAPTDELKERVVVDLDHRGNVIPKGGLVKEVLSRENDFSHAVDGSNLNSITIDADAKAELEELRFNGRARSARFDPAWEKGLKLALRGSVPVPAAPDHFSCAPDYAAQIARLQPRIARLKRLVGDEYVPGHDKPFEDEPRVKAIYSNLIFSIDMDRRKFYKILDGKRFYAGDGSSHMCIDAARKLREIEAALIEQKRILLGIRGFVTEKLKDMEMALASYRVAANACRAAEVCQNLGPALQGSPAPRSCGTDGAPK